MANWKQGALAVAGAAIGTVLTMNPMGAMMGASIGLAIGGALFPSASKTQREKPAELSMQTSQYGIPVSVVYGSNQISGNLIWYGNFKPHKVKQKGGKGGIGGGGGGSYTYTVSMAWGLCIGEAGVIKGWAGNSVLDPSTYTVYDGTQTSPDPHIQSILTTQGKTRFPTWKNLCYVVLQDYDLGSSPYIPQFRWEVVRQMDVEIEEIAEFEYVNKFGVEGIEDYEFFWPTFLAVDDTKLYIVDSDINRVKVFNKTYPFEFIQAFGSPSPNFPYSSVDGEFSVPMGITLDDDYIYVLDAGNYRIQIFDKEDCSFVGKFTPGVGEGSWEYTLYGIDVDDDYIYFTGGDPDVCAVQIHSKIAPYSFIDSFGGPRGTGNGEFEFALDVKVDDNFIYVTEVPKTMDKVNNYRLQIFNKSDYSWVDSLVGESDAYPDELIGSDSIAVTDKYLIMTQNIVEDRAILIFDKNPPYELKQKYVIEIGTGDGEFGDINGYGMMYFLCADDNYVYISDSAFYRIQVFSIYKETTTETYTTDVPPPAIIRDILTNDFYGMGIDDSTYIDDASFIETSSYCDTNDALISLAFIQQTSLLDVLQYIISHHNGYITYYNGKIYHKQLRMDNVSQDSSNSITNADYVKGSDLPVTIAKQGGKDYKNKINIEFLNRSKDYVVGTVPAEDISDIDIYGLKEDSIRMEGFKTSDRAAWAAWKILKKSLFSPVQYSFKLGIKKLGILPGNVYYLTDSDLGITNQPIRITSMSENKGVIEIEAEEEALANYNPIDSTGDPTDPPGPPDLGGDPGSVIRPILIELPAQYSPTQISLIALYSESGESSWYGASLYRSTLPDGSYEYFNTTIQSGITGVVTDVGISGNTAYITVVLDSDDTLSSAIDFNDLYTTVNKNLAMIKTAGGKEIFIRYQTVTLIAANTWKLEGIIYDTTGFPSWNTHGIIVVGDEIYFYDVIPFTVVTKPELVGRTMYAKIASMNFVGAEEDLATVSAISRVIAGLTNKPLPPYGILVNGISLNPDTTVVTASGDIVIEWKSRNRKNEGEYARDRTDTINDDADFKEFELEIYNGVTLLRTATTISKSYSYTTALQISDGAASPIGVKLRQLSIAGYVSDDYTFTITIV